MLSTSNNFFNASSDLFCCNQNKSLENAMIFNWYQHRRDYLTKCLNEFNLKRQEIVLKPFTHLICYIRFKISKIK